MYHFPFLKAGELKENRSTREGRERERLAFLLKRDDAWRAPGPFVGICGEQGPRHVCSDVSPVVSDRGLLLGQHCAGFQPQFAGRCAEAKQTLAAQRQRLAAANSGAALHPKRTQRVGCLILAMGKGA